MIKGFLLTMTEDLKFQNPFGISLEPSFNINIFTKILADKIILTKKIYRIAQIGLKFCWNSEFVFGKTFIIYVRSTVSRYDTLILFISK